MSVVKEQHPLFLKYDASVIARRMRRNEFYVLRIKSGAVPLTQKFKNDAVDEFRRPESELFLPPVPAESGAVGADDSNGGPQEEKRGRS